MEIKPNTNIVTETISNNIIKFPVQKELDLTLANYARENHQLINRNRKAKEYSDSLSFKAKLAEALNKHQPVISSLITFFMIASAIVGMTYIFVDAFFIL